MKSGLKRIIRKYLKQINKVYQQMYYDELEYFDIEFDVPSEDYEASPYDYNDEYSEGYD